MFLFDFVVVGALVAVGLVAVYVLLGSMDAKVATATVAASKSPSPAEKKKSKKNKKSSSEIKAEKEMDAIIAADMAAVSKTKGMNSDSKKSAPITLEEVRKTNERIQAAQAPVVRLNPATAEIQDIVHKEQGFSKVKNENKKKEKAPVSEDYYYEPDMDSKLRKFFKNGGGATTKKFDFGNKSENTGATKINIRGKGASKGWGEDQ